MSDPQSDPTDLDQGRGPSSPHLAIVLVFFFPLVVLIGLWELIWFDVPFYLIHWALPLVLFFPLFLFVTPILILMIHAGFQEGVTLSRMTGAFVEAFLRMLGVMAASFVTFFIVLIPAGLASVVFRPGKRTDHLSLLATALGFAAALIVYWSQVQRFFRDIPWPRWNRFVGPALWFLAGAILFWFAAARILL